MNDIQVIKLIENKGTIKATLQFDSDSFCINCECKVAQGDFVIPGALLFYLTVRRRSRIIKQDVLALHYGRIQWVNNTRMPREGDCLFAIELDEKHYEQTSTVLQTSRVVSVESKQVDGFEPEPCKYGLSPNDYKYSFKSDLDIFSFPVKSEEVVGGFELINSSIISGRIAEQALINSLCSRAIGDPIEISKEIAGLLDVIDGCATSLFICEATKRNGQDVGGFFDSSVKAIGVTFKDPNFFLEALRHEVHHMIQVEYGLKETILSIDVYDGAIASVFDCELYDDENADELIMEFESFTIEHIPFMAIHIYEALQKSVPIEDTIYAATKSRIKTIRWSAENRCLPSYGDSPSPFSSDKDTPSSVSSDSAVPEVAEPEVDSCGSDVIFDHPFYNPSNFKAIKALANDSGIAWSSRCGENLSMSDTPDFLPKTPYGMTLAYIDKLDDHVFGNIIAHAPDPILYDFMGVFYNMFTMICRHIWSNFPISQH